MGGTPVTIYGTFPTAVPVYVWFGDLGIVQAVSTGPSLLLTSPSVNWIGADTVVDVTVKFRTYTPYELTLVDAFTFRASSTGSGQSPTLPTTPAPPVTNPTAPATTMPPGGATPVTTTPAGPSTTSPPNSPGTTTPGMTTPAPTTPDATHDGGRLAGSLGRLTLRTPTAGTVVSTLSVDTWPTKGCTGSTCASS